MKNVSLAWLLLIASMVFAIVGCRDVIQVEKRAVTATESKRQIELLKELHLEEIVGKRVSDFPELFSLADEIYTKNGQIILYNFLRKGAGDNEDGSDSTVGIIVENGIIQSAGGVAIVT